MGIAREYVSDAARVAKQLHVLGASSSMSDQLRSSLICSILFAWKTYVCSEATCSRVFSLDDLLKLADFRECLTDALLR
jgi:hypothetical protein